MKTELKDCPFCGDKPTYRKGSEHYFMGGWSCSAILECCIEMSEGFGDDQMYTRSEEEAKEKLFERWNERNE